MDIFCDFYNSLPIHHPNASQWTSAWLIAITPLLLRPLIAWRARLATLCTTGDRIWKIEKTVLAYSSCLPHYMGFCSLVGSISLTSMVLEGCQLYKWCSHSSVSRYPDKLMASCGMTCYVMIVNCVFKDQTPNQTLYRVWDIMWLPKYLVTCVCAFSHMAVNPWPSRYVVGALLSVRILQCIHTLGGCSNNILIGSVSAYKRVCSWGLPLLFALWWLLKWSKRVALPRVLY